MTTSQPGCRVGQAALAVPTGCVPDTGWHFPSRPWLCQPSGRTTARNQSARGTQHTWAPRTFQPERGACRRLWPHLAAGFWPLPRVQPGRGEAWMWTNAPRFCPSNSCIQMPPIKKVDSSCARQGSPEHQETQTADRQADETTDGHTDDHR